MKTSTKYTLLLLAPVILAVICFWRSASVMSGYQDCRLDDSNIGFHPYNISPSPTNCADSRILMSHDIFQYCGIGLFILPIGVSIVLLWKEEYSGKEVIDQLKIVE